MSRNESQGDGLTVAHEFDANDRIDPLRTDIADRYAVVPASFMVFDQHTGQTIQLYHGEDAELRARRHARHLRALKRRVADENVVGE